MIPAATVAFLWLVFGGTHIGVAAMRPRIVARLGEIGFVILFYAIAAVTFAALVTYYAAHRFEGAPGPAVGNLAAARWLLMGVIGSGVMLMAPALVVYPRLPTALFGQPIQQVRGIERISRHPFFAGTALLATAHALLATRLVGAVFFIGLLLLSTLGAWHQDRKLLARRGRAYAEYCAATSMVPFAAILAGRQRLVWSELPIATFAVGLALALALRYRHDHLFAAGGVWIVAAVVGGGSVAGINAWRRSRRLRTAPRPAPHVSLRPGGAA
jgi:uncharacterized membrane protein